MKHGLRRPISDRTVGSARREADPHLASDVRSAALAPDVEAIGTEGGTRQSTAHGRETGQSIIFVAIVLPVLLLILGLAIGAGEALVQYRSVADAADLAALVGAQSLPCGSTDTTCINTAETKACTTAEQNGSDACTANGTSSTDNRANLPPLACSPYDFIDYGNASNDTPGGNANCKPATHGGAVSTYSYIEVSLTKRVRIPIFNVDVPLRAHAVATLGNGGFGKCAICIMNKTGITMSGTNSASITVNNGNVLLNSSGDTHACSINFTGTARVTASEIDNYAGGGPGAICGSSTATSTTPTQLSSQISDPFPNLPTPTCPAWAPNSGNYSLNGGNGTIGPGTYAKIDNTGTGTLTLSPGIYCITTELKQNNAGRFVGNGVLLYFTCGTYGQTNADGSAKTGCAAPGTAGGIFSMTGGTYQISPMTTGIYTGLSLFFDRNNIASPGFTLTGSSDVSSSFVGTIYGLQIGATLTGSSSAATIDSQVIIGSLLMTGTTQFTVTYNASQNYQIPGLPALIQ
ncbi:MAG TPA: pilus assembly protein TadG-related protein [Chloroflexota bacterium]